MDVRIAASRYNPPVQENSAGTKGASSDYTTGAHGRNRTGDPILTMDVLCLLSYMGS